MIKLNKGEYIRTKNGSIFKIIGGTPDDYDIDISYYDLGKIEDDIFDDLTIFNYNDNGNFIRDIMKKHSPDIIDLIEVGDYVNGKLIHCVLGNSKNGETMALYGNGKHIDNKHIKSIVTKEMMKSVEYRVV